MISAENQKAEIHVYELDFGTMGDQLDQSALSAMLHMHRVTLKNEQVTNGPKAHLARWLANNCQNKLANMTTESLTNRDQN